MKNKLISKIIITIFIMFLIYSMFISFVCAADNFDFNGFDTSADESITAPLETASQTIVSVVRIVGTGISIIMLAVIAMKYMIASPGERADLKKSSIQYSIGAIVLFGSSNIIALLVPIIEGLFQS